MILRYVPPLKSGFRAFIVVSFLILLLVLYLLLVQFGIISIIIFSFIYTIFMAVFFYSLNTKHYIFLNEASSTIEVHRLLSSVDIKIENIKVIDLKETKNAYILTIETDSQEKGFSLAGSLGFEEPPFLQFIRKIQKIKPTIGLGDYCIAVIHGNADFNPWSVKMYRTYWTYIGTVIGYYFFLLLFINILK